MKSNVSVAISRRFHVATASNKNQGKPAISGE
jgi:hypothetical protein